MRIAETAAASVIAPRALQIVIERAELAAIFFEDAAAVAGPKILPLQQGVRKQLRGGLDVGVDEGIVAFSATRACRFPGYIGSASRLSRLVPTSSITGITRVGSIPPAAV